MPKKPRTGYNPLDDFLPQIKDTREVKPQSDPERKTKPQTKAKTETQAKTFLQTSAAGIKEKAVQGAVKTRRLEDDRKRQTYWMAPDEIKMINEISKKAGVGKYQVVSAAVRMLYDYVFETGRDGE